MLLGEQEALFLYQVMQHVHDGTPEKIKHTMTAFPDIDTKKVEQFTKDLFYCIHSTPATVRVFEEIEGVTVEVTPDTMR